MTFLTTGHKVRTIRELVCAALFLSCTAHSQAQTQYVVSLAGPYFQQTGINQLGMMVGATYAATAHAWDPRNGWTAIPGFGQLTQYGYQDTYANSVNNLGEVVGRSEDDNQVPTPFIWDRVNGLRQIPGLPAGGTNVNGINDQQHIVGQMYPMGSGQPFAYLWKPGLGYVQLPGLQQGDSTNAFMINNGDVIVGASRTSDGLGHAIMWMRDESIVQLGIPPGGND